MSDRHVTRRILVPLDGSDIATVAIPHLRALATESSEILLLRVVPGPLPMIEVAGGTTIPYEDIRKRNLDTCGAYLRAVADALADITPKVRMLARIGSPADEILHIAQERDVDLILMATHGRGAVGQMLLGSVANRVAQASPMPVMLINARGGELPPAVDSEADYRRVVVPLDGSEAARTALSVATDLARQQDIPVHLIRVIPSRQQLFASRDAIDTGELYQRLVFATPLTPKSDQNDAYYEEYFTSISDALESEAHRLQPSGVDASAEVLIGPTVPSILEAVTPHDVIVMTSHGEGGVRRWLMGGVAEKLISTAASPVMLVPVEERRELMRNLPDPELKWAE